MPDEATVSRDGDVYVVTTPATHGVAGGDTVTLFLTEAEVTALCAALMS